jgi:hypothetical protein
LLALAVARFGFVGPKRAASNVGMIRRFDPELGLPADVYDVRRIGVQELEGQAGPRDLAITLDEPDFSGGLSSNSP